jgi:hypothetical protein
MVALNSLWWAVGFRGWALEKNQDKKRLLNKKKIVELVQPQYYGPARIIVTIIGPKKIIVMKDKITRFSKLIKAQ